MSSIINRKVNSYVEEICGLIKNKRVHEDVKDEIISHIEELMKDYIDVGLSEDEAVDKAIKQMGSAEVVGKDLNKIHKAAPDWLLIGMTGTFILIGFLLLNFMQKNNMVSNNYINMISNMAIYGAGGVLISLILLRVDYRALKEYSKIIYIVAIVLFIAGFFMSGAINGQIGWIRVGNITVNAFTMAPFFLITALAGLFDGWNWEDKKFLFLGFLLVFAPCIFFILRPDIVNFVIYVIAALTIMLTSGLKLRYVLITIGIGTGAFWAFLASNAYRIERFTMFLHPEQDANGAGWIYNQLAMLRSNAGLFGQGKNFNYLMLPEAHTDFIFTFLISCFGWAAGIILIALILAFIVRIFYVGTTVKDGYGKLLVNGFCALFAVQFLISVGMNLNLMPTLAVSMPFLSYGGSSLVINILSVTIISNVFKWRNTPYKAVG